MKNKLMSLFFETGLIQNIKREVEGCHISKNYINFS
ncbi:unnamed protein product [Nezara viridula]|uniref:Uncharacterized protein n=1 Tax=Nezara viridula TaxID=85310 RepID=A0A9P0EAL0_NEZVI|nr:unnamed protein product [Nezara viridula]